MKDSELERLADEADSDKTQFSRRLRSLHDFRYDERQEKYWDITIGELLGPKSVDGAIPKDAWPTLTDHKGKVQRIRPSIAINDIMTGLTVEGSTWWPGAGQFVENTVVTDRGAIPCKGAITYNTYVPPPKTKRTKVKPDPWINHIKKLWPDEYEHFFDWAALMLQQPEQKINHGIVMAGAQGIGKDTALHPLRYGVGMWNATEIDPDALSSNYNGFVQAVLLVINEVRPHDEDHKASNFYNQLKPYLAAPPEMLAMDMKYQNTIYVRNVCHVILTTNEALRMYIPPEDRRLYVMTSPLPDPKRNKVFENDYFSRLWAFLEGSGTDSVINWLLKRQVKSFNFKEAPPMTVGKKQIIDSANQVRRTEIDDIFDLFCEVNCYENGPDVVFLKDLFDFVDDCPLVENVQQAKRMLKAKNFHFKMDERGYDMVKNPYSSEFKRGNYRTRIAFCSKSVPRDEQLLRVEKELQNRPLVFKF